MKSRNTPHYLLTKIVLRFISYPLMLGVMGGTAFGMYLLGRALVRAISHLPAESQSAVLAAVITPIVTVLSVIISHWFARKREIEQAQRQRKVEFYDDFLKDYFRLLGTWKRGKAMGKTTQKEIADLTVSTARGLILWAGPETIRRWQALREQANRGEEASQKGIPVILVRFAEMLFAIRKELGHSRRGTQEAGLLSLFISDLGSDGS